MDNESKRSRTEKILKQKVAFAQLELNRLKSMEKSEQKLRKYELFRSNQQ